MFACRAAKATALSVATVAEYLIRFTDATSATQHILLILQCSWHSWHFMLLTAGSQQSSTMSNISVLDSKDTQACSEPLQCLEA